MSNRFSAYQTKVTGSTCSPSNPCPSGFNCLNEKCIPSKPCVNIFPIQAKGTGSVCSAQRPCPTGSVCNDGFCEPVNSQYVSLPTFNALYASTDALSNGTPAYAGPTTICYANPKNGGTGCKDVSTITDWSNFTPISCQVFDGGPVYGLQYTCTSPSESGKTCLENPGPRLT